MPSLTVQVVHEVASVARCKPLENPWTLSVWTWADLGRQPVKLWRMLLTMSSSGSEIEDVEGQKLGALTMEASSVE